MKIKVKVIYERNYKNGDTFDVAIDRWCDKGWLCADVVNSFKENTNAAILYLIT